MLLSWLSKFPIHHFLKEALLLEEIVPSLLGSLTHVVPAAIVSGVVAPVVSYSFTGGAGKGAVRFSSSSTA
jgi:hypothetical protein